MTNTRNDLKLICDNSAKFKPIPQRAKASTDIPLIETPVDNEIKDQHINNKLDRLFDKIDAHGKIIGSKIDAQNTKIDAHKEVIGGKIDTQKSTLDSIAMRLLRIEPKVWTQYVLVAVIVLGLFGTRIAEVTLSNLNRILIFLGF